MAEVTGLRNNALPYPIYGAPFGVTFPLLDADGDPISPSSPDSEISKNGDTFADCTNEATEIATSSGSCYLLLTATELTCDVATIQVKSTGAKTTVLTLYPRKLVTVHSGTSASGGVATNTIVLDSGASAVDDYYNGMMCIATIDSNVEVRVISDYVGSTKTASVSPDWNVAPDSDDTFIVKLPEGALFSFGDAKAWLGSALAAVTNAGVPEVDVTHWRGGAVPAVSVTGVPEVDITHVNGVAQTATLDTIKGDTVDIETDTQDIQSRLPAALTGDGNIKADALMISGSATAADNAEIVFATDFAINYSTTTDKWQVEANVLQIEGVDATNQIRDSVVDDATRIDASALNTASVTTIPAIVADTNELQTDWTNGGRLDLLLDATLADTNELQTDWTNGGRLDLIIDAILLDTAEIGTAGAGLSDIPWNADWDAEVQSEVDDALVAQKLDHLVAVADADDVADNSIIAKLASKGATADWSSFVNTTDALEAIRDRGDAAWITATGFSTHSAADVWSVATRLLTAGTNIALAKGTGVTGFNDLSAADVNAEVLDVLNTDTFAEPTGTPSTTATLAAKLGLIQMALVNGLDITATKKQFKDAAGNVEWEKDLSDDGTTYTETAGNAP